MRSNSAAVSARARVVHAHSRREPEPGQRDQQHRHRIDARVVEVVGGAGGGRLAHQRARRSARPARRRRRAPPARRRSAWAARPWTRPSPTPRRAWPAPRPGGPNVVATVRTPTEESEARSERSLARLRPPISQRARNTNTGRTPRASGATATHPARPPHPTIAPVTIVLSQVVVRSALYTTSRPAPKAKNSEAQRVQQEAAHGRDRGQDIRPTRRETAERQLAGRERVPREGGVDVEPFGRRLAGAQRLASVRRSSTSLSENATKYPAHAAMSPMTVTLRLGKPARSEHGAESGSRDRDQRLEAARQVEECRRRGGGAVRRRPARPQPGMTDLSRAHVSPFPDCGQRGPFVTGSVPPGAGAACGEVFPASGAGHVVLRRPAEGARRAACGISLRHSGHCFGLGRRAARAALGELVHRRTTTT